MATDTRARTPEGAWSPEVAAPGITHRPEGLERRKWIPARWPVAWTTAGALALLIVVWTALILALPGVHFAMVSPRARIAVEAAGALARLFAALVLFLFPSERDGQRLRWLAAGFLILGLGSLIFGYVRPLLSPGANFNTSIYAALFVWTLAGLLFFCGLVPKLPPPLTRSMLGVALGVFLLGMVAVARLGAQLPELVRVTALQAAADTRHDPIPGLTHWYWFLAALPLVLAVVNAIAATVRSRRGPFGVWMPAAMVAYAGAHLHNLFWPSAFSPVLTTADLLRLLFAGTVTVGGIVELQRIASERSALLAVAEEHSKRLTELAVLKSDFTRMVAHELGSPLAAIRGYVDMLATGDLGPEEQRQAIKTIGHETKLLTALVEDVRASATIEREDFRINLRPVPLAGLIADAVAYTRTLPGDHPMNTPLSIQGMVSADPERIGQVLRNLLNNAAKYSSPGTPIAVRTLTSGRRIRIEVADSGFGIRPEDIVRIFEKFGRGADQQGRRVPGVGLGLYLSRRIIQAHGSDLTVQSTPGKGSVFGFDLEVVV